MPIKPENKNKYPNNWLEIRKRQLEKYNNRCAFCGVKNYAVGKRDKRESASHYAQGEGKQKIPGRVNMTYEYGNEKKRETKKSIVIEVFMSMPKEFNLYNDFFPKVEAEVKRRLGKNISQQGIGATMRKHCYYTVVDKNKGTYRRF